MRPLPTLLSLIPKNQKHPFLSASAHLKYRYTYHLFKDCTRHMNVFRRANNVITETDNIILLLIGIGVGLVIALGGPRVIPDLQRGIYCENVGPPMGGNHRSLLALKDGDTQDLELEVRISPEEVVQGEDIEFLVIFRNEDIGPINLYMPRTDPAIGSREDNVGLRLEIENVVTRAVVQDNVVNTIRSSTFNDDEMHLIKSHSRCSVSVVLDGGRLAALGILPGEYIVRAFYTNSQSGIPEPLEDETETLIFTNQGVWTGTTSSDAVEFEVLPAPTPTPPPVPGQ